MPEPVHATAEQVRQRQDLSSQLWHSFARMWEGFEIIAGSHYLNHLSTYIVFTTVIASLMYFEKSMVINCPYPVCLQMVLVTKFCCLVSERSNDWCSIGNSALQRSPQKKSRHTEKNCVCCADNGVLQVVAAAASDAASRMALFGSINSASAVVIAALQLAATGRLLKRLGLATALTVSPTFAAVLMLGIAVWPTPVMVASGEVLRKVGI